MKTTHFSYAFVFRPASKNETSACDSLRAVVNDVRARPEMWECLLMQRTYAKKEWDTFGGAANEGETPEETIRREFLEESGVPVKSLVSLGQIRRRYRDGILVGSGFAVEPENEFECESAWTKFDRSEVANVCYFPILSVHDGEPFLRVLGARFRAFLANDSDADCIRYLDPRGIERCRAAGEDVSPSSQSAAASRSGDFSSESAFGHCGAHEGLCWQRTPFQSNIPHCARATSHWPKEQTAATAVRAECRLHDQGFAAAHCAHSVLAAAHDETFGGNAFQDLRFKLHVIRLVARIKLREQRRPDRGA